ncbi:MAG: hypothetical protein AB1351_05800 [Thermoproteota archaeon]
MNRKVAIALVVAISLLTSPLFHDAEAKQMYASDLGQTYAVFTMIALAIAGFGILLALYTRESIVIKNPKID